MATVQGHSPLDVRGRILQQAGLPTSLVLATSKFSPHMATYMPQAQTRQCGGGEDQAVVTQVQTHLACEPVTAAEVALDRKEQRDR